jgi:hydrogenase expression/formation protein HypD
VALQQTRRENTGNLYFPNSQKQIPPIIRALLKSQKLGIDGFMLPGHVSTIIGKDLYQFISEEFQRPVVITGFEPLDILQGILMLIAQIEEKRAAVEIEYRRAVHERGNSVAISKIAEAFETDGAHWRGLGWIPESGYRFRAPFESLNARNLDAEVQPSNEHPEG